MSIKSVLLSLVLLIVVICGIWEMGLHAGARQLHQVVQAVWASPATPKESATPPSPEMERQYVRLAGCWCNCRCIATALESYAAEHRGLYPRSLSSLYSGYLKHLPKCPAAGKDTYSPSYIVSADGRACTFHCKGTSHKAAGVKPNVPRFDSSTGRLDEKSSSIAEGLSFSCEAAIDDLLVKGRKPSSPEDPYEACQSNCKNIAIALEMWSTNHKGRYPTLLSDLTPAYLKMLPTCPAAGKDTYSASYTTDGKASYSFCCKGKHHAAIGVPADYPKYTSEQGIVLAQNVKAPPKPPAYSLSYCKESIKYVGVALEMYAMDNGRQYPKKLGQLVPGYLKKIPACPAAGRDTYSDSYSVKTNPPSYLIYCKGNQHTKMGIPANFPQYSIAAGLRTKP
ncbi:MAG: hypothetical protein HYU64_09390 [Armatimonadetes bacterium]|nr:hypothetical protein [Armatimonadota bacterium]